MSVDQHNRRPTRQQQKNHENGRTTSDDDVEGRSTRHLVWLIVVPMKYILLLNFDRLVFVFVGNQDDDENDFLSNQNGMYAFCRRKMTTLVSIGTLTRQTD